MEKRDLGIQSQSAMYDNEGLIENPSALHLWEEPQGSMSGISVFPVFKPQDYNVNGSPDASVDFTKC